MPKQLDGLDLDLDIDLDVDFDFDGDAEDGGDIDIDAMTTSSPDPLAAVEYVGNVEADTKAELNALQSGFIARAKQENARREKATDSEYWFCVCFQSRDQVEEFLKKSGWAKPNVKYIDGQQVAKAIGVKLTPDTTGFGQTRIDRKLAKFTMEVSDEEP